MAKKIVFAAAKGGVGKTTSIQNIGAYFASKGYKVLAIDIDPQSNLTCALKEDVLFAEKNIITGLRKKDFSDCIYNVKENLDIIPCFINAESLNLEIAGLPSREMLLKKALKKIENNYDFILIDPNTALTTLTYNALTVADSLYIPLRAGKFEIYGFRWLMDEIKAGLEDLNPGLEFKGVFLTHRKNANLTREIEELLTNHVGEKLLDVSIRDNIALAEAQAIGIDIFEHKPQSNGAKDYKKLGDFILKLERMK